MNKRDILNALCKEANDLIAQSKICMTFEAPEKALIYIDQAYRLFKIISSSIENELDEHMKSIMYMNLSNLCYQLSQFSEAIEWGKMGLIEQPVPPVRNQLEMIIFNSEEKLKTSGNFIL